MQRGATGIQEKEAGGRIQSRQALEKRTMARGHKAKRIQHVSVLCSALRGKIRTPGDNALSSQRHIVLLLINT